jgi:hypothetical protein
MPILDEQELYVPGRPDYIYYQGKCYRKTGQRVYSGTTFALSGIAVDIESITSTAPVVIFSSCEACQGISELFSLAELVAAIVIRPPGFTDDTYTGGPVVGKPVYTLADVQIQTDLWQYDEASEVLSSDPYYPYGTGTPQAPIDTAGVYKVDDISVQADIYQFITGDIWSPHPTDESDNDIYSILAPLSAGPALSCSVYMKADGDTFGDADDDTWADTYTYARFEGTTGSTAPPADPTEWSDPTKWSVVNSPGAWTNLP